MAKKRKTKVTTFKNFARRVWDINPVEKVVPSKKAYKRNPKHKGKDNA